jgi:GNAT superfamily N-acetyltransferase
LAVHKDYRRKGIARKLLGIAYERATAQNKTKLSGTLLNEAARELLKKLGGNEALAYRINQLNLDEVDWDLMEAWAEQGPQRSPTTTLNFYQEIPDSLLDEYCNVYTEVLNQAPRDELTLADEIITPESWATIMRDNKEAGTIWTGALTIEDDGSISGLTEIVYNPANSSIVYQELTGVQDKYRRRGLGKWLKAAMLLRVRKEYPDVKLVSTSNATSNEPMLAINERMGFRVSKEVYLSEVDIKNLKDYLSK